MPSISQNFKFEYFIRGGVYSAASEYRRFMTVDYNLQSYVGVIGVGIIDGWSIEQTTDTQIRILPGIGIINGYFAESPYVAKRRSEIVSGEREVDVVKLQEAPEPDMTDSEADHYVSVIQEYDPSYNPSRPIENSWIKVVIPKIIDLDDNSDTYIWVTRSYYNYYPPLSDYPYYLIRRPNINDYNTYDQFLSVFEAYQSQINYVYDYQFRDASENHFTEVTFNTAQTFLPSPTKVLLGKVVTRNNEVIRIDTSGVDTVKNLESAIKNYANEIIPEHHHGGSQRFDPARVNLETDFRQSILTSYNDEAQRGTFSILESKLTEQSIGHRHTFTIDSDGNGQTIGIIGDAENHFHKIIENEIQTQEFTNNDIEDHTHTLPDISNFVWDDTSQYVVYVNGIPIGDETSENITVDPENKTITLIGIIGGVTKTFGVNFSYEGTSYEYSSQSNSVFRFMLGMISDFNSKFADTDINTNPFVFFDEETGIVSGVQDLKDQSVAAEALLRESGDTFVFTPDAARNIELTLVDYQKVEGFEADNVTIEILGNSEVTGVVRPENIFFINAQKIKSGIFEISQIPFLSHIGRTNEGFYSTSYPLISRDGFNFLVTPSKTDIQLGHSHNLILNEKNDGFTEQTYVDDQPVYYGVTENQSYLIAHIHSVQDEIVQDAESDGLLEWQNEISSQNQEDSTHSHDIYTPINGNVKVVYSIGQDRHGNLYAGTSDDLIMIPNEDSYVFVINDLQFYENGTDLLTMFENAKRNYEQQTGTPLKITSDIYNLQIQVAESQIKNVGDSYLIVGKSEQDSDADITMIQKLAYIPVPNYEYSDLKDFDEIGGDEVVTSVEIRLKSTGALLDPNDPDVQSLISSSPDSVAYVARVKRYFDSIPATSIEVQEVTSGGVTNDKILTVGKDIIATNINIHENFYVDWKSPDTPSSVGVFRDAEQDEEGSVWVASNNGVLVLRSHNQGTVLSKTQRPGASPDIKDILVIRSDSVFCSSDGIYKTENQGKSWDKKLSGNFNQIIPDLGSIIIKENYGHAHEASINIMGDGILEANDGHTHEIDTWVSNESNSHTHDIIIPMYAISNLEIYKSLDNGESWNFLYDLPSGENGKIFVYNNVVYLPKNDGIYVYSNDWRKINNIAAYSFKTSYDLESFYVGSENKIYQYSNSEFVKVFEFDGSPLPTLTVNGSSKYYGYAYGNRNKTFYLNDSVVSDEEISCFVNFDKWYSENGSWPENVDYDIYINNKLILSTKDDVDNRQERNWSFSVDSSLGLVDFSGEANLLNSLSVFDSFISVDDASSFQEGDRILIQRAEENSGNSEDDPEEDLSNENIQTYQDAEKLAESNNEEREIKTSFLYTTITLIDENIIFFEPKSIKKIDLPAKVFKIPNLDANSEIRLNIYDSFLSQFGKNTHQEIEDKISYNSDQRPYELNNSYLSNLLQLTQAIRYVYPNINSLMQQSVFYDFHYSENPDDENYYKNYIDIPNSEAYSLVNFQSPFEPNGSTAINKIFIGSGTFDGKIIVGTDIGIFWAELDQNLNANWFYIWEIRIPIYDISVFGEENLLVATENGVYVTQDMVEWEFQDFESVRFPAFSMSLRWPEDSFVIVAPHTASFSNIGGDPAQATIQTSQELYSNLIEFRSIKIETLDDPLNPKNNKTYIVTKVSPKSLTISSEFDVEETLNNVKITMGSWWQQFDGEDNIGNNDLTNTLLVGGKNKISYTPYLEDFSWTEGKFDVEVKDVNIVDFLPISTGSILASAVGTNSLSVTHYILRSFDLGSYWFSYKKFTEIRGNIISSKISTFGHSILTVDYTDPFNFRYADNDLDKRRISIFSGDSPTPIFSGRIISNQGFDSTIALLGRKANDIVNDSSVSLSFEIYPVSVNSMIETDNRNILFGTDIGIYEDSQTTTGLFPFEGQVWSVGDPGTITNIDISGTISSVGSNPVNNNVVLSVSCSSNITKDQFVNDTIYIVDLPLVTGYKILNNSTRTVGGDITLEIEEEYIDAWITYVGKNIKFVEEYSFLDVEFDYAVLKDQLKGGTITISSNENNNIGKTYDIISNTTNRIVIDGQIFPYNVTRPESDNNDAIAGQSFIGIDSSKRIKLNVTFTNEIVDNYLVDFSFKITNNLSSASDISGITVYQNSRNQIVLNDFSDLLTSNDDQETYALLIDPNDYFRLTGDIYQPLSSFNNKRTSTDSSHYHDLELVGGFVKGSIDEFIENTASTVEFSVADTTNFNIDLVQKDGTLFEEARIRFFNPQDIGVEYFSTVISHTNNSITVKLLNIGNWDFEEYKNSQISTTWNWEIDATNYGYTQNIYYEDFVTSSNIVTEDISIEDSIVKVDDTSNMLPGDKIIIISSADKSENNFIKSIIDSTTIELQVVASNSYFISNTVQVKVLRDEFSNIHEHMVRNNQVKTIRVEDYLNRGLPSDHSHRNIALINVISDIEKRGNEIIVVGSSNFIYNSNNNGLSWNKMSDLNDFVEENLEIDGIVDIDTTSNRVIAGTSSGEIFSTGNESSEIIPLNQPKVN